MFNKTDRWIYLFIVTYSKRNKYQAKHLRVGVKINHFLCISFVNNKKVNQKTFIESLFIAIRWFFVPSFCLKLLIHKKIVSDTFIEQCLEGGKKLLFKWIFNYFLSWKNTTTKNVFFKILDFFFDKYSRILWSVNASVRPD